MMISLIVTGLAFTAAYMSGYGHGMVREQKDNERSNAEIAALIKEVSK